MMRLFIYFGTVLQMPYILVTANALGINTETIYWWLLYADLLVTYVMICFSKALCKY